MKKMWKFVFVVLFAFLTFSGSNFVYAANDTSGELLVGAAIRDITPTEENGLLPVIWSVAGKDAMLEGVHDPIHTRVVAISDGEDTALIICVETGKGPYGPQFAQALADHAGIPVEAVFFTTTHVHSAPEIKTAIDLSLDINDDEISTLERWAKYSYLQMCDAIDEAMSKMKPATVGIGYTNSYINVNRGRTHILDDGTQVVRQGYNPEGFSDKTLAVIRFDDLEGNPIAFITNYACHATAMYLNADHLISADIPGYVSTTLEKNYEGTVAVWLSGAAGDQNPIIADAVLSPNPETKDSYVIVFENMAYELTQYLGDIQYADVLTAMDNIDEMKQGMDVAFGYDGTTIPSKTAESGEWGVQLQLIRIGNIALVGHGGELYNSFAVEMRENSLLENTLVVDNTWTHEEQHIDYHPDDNAMINGSYHNTELYEAGYLKDALIEVMNHLIEDSQN